MDQANLGIALRAALAEIRAAKDERWLGFEGEDLNPKLERLESTLQAALERLTIGQLSDSGGCTGLAKWVADWIPDLEHPLLEHLHKIEISSLGSGRT